MSKVLDRSRDFAAVYGESKCRYMQDGFEFDNAGNLIAGGSDNPILQQQAKTFGAKAVSKTKTESLITNDLDDQLAAQSEVVE